MSIEEIVDLRQKYEKLLIFTVELTAARDRIAKENDKLQKEIKVLSTF
jgi:hypothetical protein